MLCTWFLRDVHRSKRVIEGQTGHQGGQKRVENVVTLTDRQLLRSLNNHKMVSGTYQIIAPSKNNCLKLNRTGPPKDGITGGLHFEN